MTEAGRAGRDLLRPFLAAVCGLMLMAMMGLTVVDVIGRYLFGAPLTGATELTEILLVGLVFLGLPAVCLDDEHVTVDLLSSRFPAALQPLRRLVVGLVSVAVLGVVAWRLWMTGAQIAGYGGTTNSLRLPVAPVAYMAAGCTAVSAAITLWVTLAGLRGAAAKPGRAA